jgi:hypothetical protein
VQIDELIDYYPQLYHMAEDAAGRASKPMDCSVPPASGTQGTAIGGCHARSGLASELASHCC